MDVTFAFLNEIWAKNSDFSRELALWTKPEGKFCTIRAVAVGLQMWYHTSIQVDFVLLHYIGKIR